MDSSESISRRFTATGFCRVDAALSWWARRYFQSRGNAGLRQASFDARGWGEHRAAQSGLVPRLGPFSAEFEATLSVICGKPTRQLGNFEFPQYAFAREISGDGGYDRHIDGAGLDREEPAGRYEVLIAILLHAVRDADDGAFVVWPGSHREVFDSLSARPHERLRTAIHDCVPDLANRHSAALASPPVAFTGNAGDALICHHLMVHGNASRRRPGVRRMLFFRPGYMAYDKDALVEETSFVRL
jgi:phytanoyl-CoA dioxygenase PhyH